MRTTKRISRFTMIMLCLILCISLLAACAAEETPTTESTDAPTTAAPSATEATPTEAEPTATEAEPTATEAAPTETEAAPTETEPTATEAEPTATETEPTATETEPTATETEPEASESEPVASESEPEASESEPEASESEPEASESEPEASESEPEASESDPEASESETLPLIDLEDYEYENPILFHTPTLDGVIDDEYYKSYHFDNKQCTEVVSALTNANGGVPQYDAYSNRSTTYILWDGDFIYVAVERWDNDLIARSKAYVEATDADGDVNPWYNDNVEVWYVFDMTYPKKDKDMHKVSYDACGIDDGPFSAISEDVYSQWFLDCEVKVTYEIGANPADEQGYCDKSVFEFKIPAKTESGDALYADDFIFIAIQSGDIAYATDAELEAKGHDPATFVPDELASDITSGYTFTWTRARTVFPTDDGENGGFGKGYLTEIRPSQVADPE